MVLTLGHSKAILLHQRQRAGKRKDDLPLTCRGIRDTTRDLTAVVTPWLDNPLSYFGLDADKARDIYNRDRKLDTTEVRLMLEG